MKLKHRGRYVGFIIVISCITLLPIKLTSNNNDNSNNDIKNKSRFIIKSTEKAYISANKENSSNRGTRASSQNGNSEVQLLPIPDANSQIIITPLSPDKM